MTIFYDTQTVLNDVDAKLASQNTAVTATNTALTATNAALATVNASLTTAQASLTDIDAQLVTANARLMGFTPRVAATYTRASDATQYAIGDIIANTTTAASVVPISFTAARVAGGSGRLTGCRAVLTAASGTIVLPAFDLLVFRPETSIPFAAAGYPADNAALTVSSAAMIQKVAIFSFSATNWRNSAGGATAAGAAIYQTVGLSSTRPYAPFNLTSCGGSVVLGILQAQNTWNPGAVSQQFDFALDVDQD